MTVYSLYDENDKTQYTIDTVSDITAFALFDPDIQPKENSKNPFPFFPFRENPKKLYIFVMISYDFVHITMYMIYVGIKTVLQYNKLITPNFISIL